jgi:hypothetical protein
MNTHLIWSSSNRKLGPMPTAFASKKTCPSTCPLKGTGCYAGEGPINITWNKVTDGSRGTDWKTFVGNVRKIAPGTLWRYGVTGDLPGEDVDVDPQKLAEMTAANKGKRGYTYTHKPRTAKNLRAIRQAIAGGFMISLSANSPKEADRLAKHGLPLVTLVPEETPKTFKTPGGMDGVICPAQELEHMTCYSCGYCAKPGHKLVGFRPHGSGLKKVAEVIRTCQ